MKPTVNSEAVRKFGSEDPDSDTLCIDCGESWGSGHWGWSCLRPKLSIERTLNFPIRRKLLLLTVKHVRPS